MQAGRPGVPDTALIVVVKRSVRVEDNLACRKRWYTDVLITCVWFFILSDKYFIVNKVLNFQYLVFYRLPVDMYFLQTRKILNNFTT